MKNSILLIALLLGFAGAANGQMTLAHTFSGDSTVLAKVVNLSRSGKKLQVIKGRVGTTGNDTVYYYNTDFSLWKTIICPSIPGYYTFFFQDYWGYPGYGVCYTSETLFNSDTLLEVAVNYVDPMRMAKGKLMIINEMGAFVDSISDIFSHKCIVNNISSGRFILTVMTPTGTKVYNLPGTLPCDSCSGGGSLGWGKVEPHQPADLLSAPVPNPSQNQVKITFTLPEGATRGQLTIYNNNGQQMRSYTVDNRFGFIMVDNSDFAPGMYHYNLTVNGAVSTTQKMVVIK